MIGWISEGGGGGGGMRRGIVGGREIRWKRQRMNDGRIEKDGKQDEALWRGVGREGMTWVQRITIWEKWWARETYFVSSDCMDMKFLFLRKDKFTSLKTQVHDFHHSLEKVVAQWNKFSKDCKELCDWLREMDDTIQEAGELQSTAEEKRTQADRMAVSECFHVFISYKV